MPIIQCFNENCHYFDLDEPDHCSKPLHKIQECPDTTLEKLDSVKNKSWYYQEMMSNQCLCGNTKKKGHSFCWNCFSSLSVSMQNSLYKQIGKGYEEAFEEAVKWLWD